MYSNILIPVSFDENRDVNGAINVAKALSSDGTRITFMHVIESMPTYVADFIPPEAWQERREAAKEKVLGLAETVNNAHGIVIDGTSGRTITSWATDNGVDLIVIPSHRPQVSDVILGSTAAWVVRHANCCVHVVR